MATPLDIKKAKAELLRVQSSMAEIEVRIEDHKENIARLEASLEISKAKEKELLEAKNSK